MLLDTHKSAAKNVRKKHAFFFFLTSLLTAIKTAQPHS